MLGLRQGVRSGKEGKIILCKECIGEMIALVCRRRLDNE